MATLDSTTSLLDSYEKGALLHALRLSQGDKLAAARLLKVGKSTFYRKLKQHGIA
jgi:transcriptional regulator of acetoin/glycerol metabolism